jgi:hypothetical protein
MPIFQTVSKNDLFTFIKEFHPIEKSGVLAWYLNSLEEHFDRFILEVDDNMMNNFTNDDKLKYLTFIRERAYDFFETGNPLDRSTTFNNCETFKRSSDKYTLRDESSITELVLQYFEDFGSAKGIEMLESELQNFQQQRFLFPKVSFPYLDSAKNELIALLKEINYTEVNKQVLDIILSNKEINTIEDEHVRFYCRSLYFYILKIRSSEILWEIIGYCTINIRNLTQVDGIEPYFNNTAHIASLTRILINNKIIDEKHTWQHVMFHNKQQTAKNIIYALIESLHTNGIINRRDDIHIRRGLFTFFKVPHPASISRIQDKNKHHSEYVKYFNRLLKYI